MKVDGESIVPDRGDVEMGIENPWAAVRVVVVRDPSDSPCVNAALIGYMFVVNALFLALNLWHVSAVFNYRSHQF